MVGGVLVVIEGALVLAERARLVGLAVPVPPVLAVVGSNVGDVTCDGQSTLECGVAGRLPAG
ncbi:hypothetical protein CLV43_1281 [Umezawaea tangerina]|uniref:Uncharacterized protein n=1 Tax=Umezawaea tangerina TaxID=84725 RepID=A0A2T0S574_9PSEU|nr:hypothetical protein CLV43_1281 [Umezawaea tangerina]